MKYFYLLAICVTILIGLSIETTAQNVEKAFNLIETKDYEKALLILNKCVEKNKDPLVAKYGIALIYNDKTYDKYNSTKAFYNINAVNQRFLKLTATQKVEYEKKFSLTQKSIDGLLENVAYDNYLKTKEINTLEAYNSFLDTFKDTFFARHAEASRDSIAFYDAKKVNTLEALQIFYKKYPGSIYSDSAKNIYENIWRQICYDSFSECEYDNIAKFMKKYPDYPFYNDSLKKIYEFSVYASKLNLYLGYLENNLSYYIEFLKKAAPLEPAFVCLQRIMYKDISEKKWENAIDTLEKYKIYFKTDPRIDGLIKILKNKNLIIDAKNISPLVNTDAYEYAPVISADGEYLYFCGRDRIDNLGLEDIFVATKKDKKWEVPTLLKDINNKYSNEAPLSISTDGTKLFLFSDGDIFFSQKTKTGWAKMQSFPIINSASDWEADAMITADGEAVLFVSDRSNGIGYYHEQSEVFRGSMSGNTDIYVSVKQGNTWGKPINLGEKINTKFAERSVFLHPDMKTLYFSSEGHNSFGRLDVFKSTRLYDTSWVHWSEPENLGKEINTGDDEYGYKITTDGRIAYFTMFNGNQSDIYYFEMPAELRPMEIATIKGKVYDKDSINLEAEIVWENLAINEKIGSSNTNPENGQYFITLPLGKKYGYYVNKTGYYPVSGNIDLTKITTSIEIEKNFKLLKTEDIINNQISIPLNNLFFDNNKYELKPESYPELKRLSEFLNSNPTVKIEISGHTDNVGKPEYNKELSEKRAAAVKDYLISLNCKKENLISIGYGDTKPIAKNTTDQGKALNRRVEFKVTK